MLIEIFGRQSKTDLDRVFETVIIVDFQVKKLNGFDAKKQH